MTERIRCSLCDSVSCTKFNHCKEVHEPKSVVQEWMSTIPFMMQSVVLTALRGCDGVRKDDPSKPLVRFLRSFVLRNARKNPGSFFREEVTWDQVEQLFDRGVDQYPLHWFMHFLHATEIIGYKHPTPQIRNWWRRVYRYGVDTLHLSVESEKQLDARLGYQENG